MRQSVESWHTAVTDPAMPVTLDTDCWRRSWLNERMGDGWGRQCHILIRKLMNVLTPELCRPRACLERSVLSRRLRMLR